MAYGEGLRRNRCGIWCWRWVVPTDLRRAFLVREVSRSLDTASKREALARSLPLRAAVVHLIELARAGKPVNEKLKALLERAQERALERERFEAMEQLFSQAIDERNVARAALGQQAEKHDEEVKAAVAQGALAAASTIGARPAAPVLSACFDRFVSERSATESWTDKTRERWRFTFRCLLEGLGDRPVDQVSREDFTRFLEQLKRLPSNAQKKPTLKGKTFLQLVEVEGYEPISWQTVNDHMTRVSGFFKWAVNEADFLAKNLATNLTIKGVRNEERLPFDEDELIRLFSHDNFKSRTFLHPHYYWIMLLGIYTGMRLNEACQLRLEDFQQVRSVDVIHCKDDPAAGQRGKNANMVRRVPVHQELIRLGLLRYVDRLRARGETQLFPELKPGRDGHGQAPSKWFLRYRVACGVGTGSKQVKVFHSFRNLHISSLVNAEVGMQWVAAIVGHETGWISGDIYWTDRDALKLQEKVNCVVIPESVRQLIPTFEEVKIAKTPRIPPSRSGAFKSREKRVSDVAARKAKKGSAGSATIGRQGQKARKAA